jgi:amidase
MARLRAAGAVILGKTNVPAMAGDWQSYNEIFGTTNNPWDLNRTPGGSTGGGAAAVAIGLGYVSIGSDIAGSIRLPAHFCGVYGHKPTADVIPMRGHIPPPPGSPPTPPSSLFVAGFLARGAGDLKTALEVLGGPDSEEAKAYRWSLPPARRSRLADYRIGYILDDPACPVDPEIREVMAEVIRALRKAGARVDEGWPAGMHPASQYATYVYLFNLGLPDEQETKPEGTSETKRSLGWITPYKRFSAAEQYRIAARAIWRKYFDTHDVFILPTAFMPAFPHDHSADLETRVLATSEGPRQYLDLLFWNSFATFAGLPATTAPAGFTRGRLPVGLQIIGPYLEDSTPIDLAARLAEVIGGFKAPPGY